MLLVQFTVVSRCLWWPPTTREQARRATAGADRHRALAGAAGHRQRGGRRIQVLLPPFRDAARRGWTPPLPPRRTAVRPGAGGRAEHFIWKGRFLRPGDDDSLHVWCSTQHPSEMQQLIAHALGWRASNHRQLSAHGRGVWRQRIPVGAMGLPGGAAGSAHWPASRLRLDRDEDMSATGLSAMATSRNRAKQSWYKPET